MSHFDEDHLFKSRRKEWIMSGILEELKSSGLTWWDPPGGYSLDTAGWRPQESICMVMM